MSSQDAVPTGSSCTQYFRVIAKRCAWIGKIPFRHQRVIPITLQRTLYNSIHHKVANNSKKYTTMEADNKETDKILTN